eukprot:gene3051-3513_t
MKAAGILVVLQEFPQKTSGLILIGFIVFVLMHLNGIVCSHWQDFHRNDALYHDLQYHERAHEASMRNEEARRYHHEELLEFQSKYMESVREHEHEHQEALRRDDEQYHENDEAERENEVNSRQTIPSDPNEAVIDQRSAASFLKRWPKKY